VTLGLHAGALLGHPAVAARQELSMAALAAVAVVATWAGTGGPAGGETP
jgi:hypothetical protein